MLHTAPMNSKRAQDFVLSAMDRVVFRPPSLLRVRDQVAWANAKLFPGAFLSIGDMAFKMNIEEIVVDIFGGEHTADLVSILTLSTTIARFLLSKGVYEDVVPCPFKGMEEPMGVGEGWRIYLATYLSASPIHGPMNLCLFLRDTFTVLAQAAFRSLNPRAHLIKPRPHTTCAQAKHTKRVKLNNNPKMKTMEEKSILYDKAASEVRPPPSPSPKTTGKRHRHQTAAPVCLISIAWHYIASPSIPFSLTSKSTTLTTCWRSYFLCRNFKRVPINDHPILDFLIKDLSGPAWTDAQCVVEATLLALSHVDGTLIVETDDNGTVVGVQKESINRLPADMVESPPVHGHSTDCLQGGSRESVCRSDSPTLCTDEETCGREPSEWIVVMLSSTELRAIQSDILAFPV
ncbi:hypothetical protein B0H16DRAFT_1472391 [Mycena metata]|uniref:Uncharacterized protein n=1 Tax=Mycena metata TaxID=1033252 RepID=A0AAD7MN67_9AGAR|nr:hypothetical protein B0H16DRAFT_1472391 [Mycena metata]